METIVDHLARQAETRPDQPFVSDGRKTLDFAAFFTRVRRYAGFLAEQGVRPGDRVALYVDRRVPHLLGYFASMALGAIPVHLLAQKTHAHVAFAAAHTGASLVLTDSADLDPAGLPCRCVRTPEADATLPERWTDQRHDVAYMMFTSGTTGQPKAVMTTQANVLFVTRTLTGIAGMRPGDREIIVMPLAATGGLGHLHANLLLGNHATLLPYFFSAMDDDDMRHMLGVIESESISGFLSTPGMLGRLVEHHRDAFQRQARGVRYILANVTPMRPDLVRDLIGLLPDTRFYTYYGLTEASRSVYLCYNDNPDRLRSAGRPTPGVAIRLAKPSAEARIGEVLIRGGNVASGYWRQPEPGLDADGWFRSGDLGDFDDDGYLTIHGRVKDNIKIDGMECYPHDIEAVLERHPAVKECAVLAVPDHTTYERVGAAVVPHADADTDTLIADLTALCRRHLEVYKVPTQFLLLESLPRAGLGKIDRQGLRDRMVRLGPSGDVLPPALRGASDGVTAPEAASSPAAPVAASSMTAEEEFATPLPEAFRTFQARHTPERRRLFRHRLGETLGIHYQIGPTPIFLERPRFERLAATTEAVVRFLRSPAYQAGVAEAPWFLPRDPIGPQDCIGSVDFHVGADEAKIIEVNFFPPGFIGLLELMESTLFQVFDLTDFTPVNAGFEAELVATVTEDFRFRRLALAVNHTKASEPYLAHYRHVERIFRRHGVDCRLVYARDVELDADGHPRWDGERYDRVFSLVIPRIMEHDPAPFARFIELYHRHPEVVYPRALGWKLGMKGMLADFHRLDPVAYGLSPDDAALIAAATLPAHRLSAFADAEAVVAAFGGRRFVLKPLDNYDTQGIYLRPTGEDVRRVFAEARDYYVAQAWFPHPHMPFLTERGEVVPYQYSLRMGFLGGRCRGIRGASFLDTRSYDDYANPVVVV